MALHLSTFLDYKSAIELFCRIAAKFQGQDYSRVLDEEYQNDCLEQFISTEKCEEVSAAIFGKVEHRPTPAELRIARISGYEIPKFDVLKSRAFYNFGLRLRNFRAEGDVGEIRIPTREYRKFTRWVTEASDLFENAKRRTFSLILCYQRMDRIPDNGRIPFIATAYMELLPDYSASFKINYFASFIPEEVLKGTFLKSERNPAKLSLLLKDADDSKFETEIIFDMGLRTGDLYTSVIIIYNGGLVTYGYGVEIPIDKKIEIIRSSPRLVKEYNDAWKKFPEWADVTWFQKPDSL